jgi:arylsulfatase A-like enzyme
MNWILARRAVFTVAIGVAISVVISSCHRRATRAVVLITMESVNARDFSAGHGPFATGDTTPVEQGTSFSPPHPEDLDDLAALGTRFSAAFAPSGSALASLVSIFTGRAPEASGVYCDLDSLADTPTLADALSQWNVRCGAFVARPSITKAAGLARGFETYIIKPREGDAEGDDAGTAARAWLESSRLAHPGDPLFCWIHLSMPRPPFQPQDEYIRRFSRTATRDDGSLQRLEALATGRAEYTNDARDAVDALHAACILQDAAVASRFLKSSRPAFADFDRVTVIFAGTNGEELGARGSFGSRRTLGDATLHVPLYFYRSTSTGLPPVCGTVVGLASLAKTIAREFGVDPPSGATEDDLLSIAQDRASAGRAVYSSFEDRIFTIRTARRRFVSNPLGLTISAWPPKPPSAPGAPPREELYDCDADPLERRNLAPAGGGELLHMRALAEQARGAARARFPVAERDGRRLKLLHDEGIHRGDGHPSTPPPPTVAGGK